MSKKHDVPVYLEDMVIDVVKIPGQFRLAADHYITYGVKATVTTYFATPRRVVLVKSSNDMTVEWDGRIHVTRIHEGQAWPKQTIYNFHLFGKWIALALFGAWPYIKVTYGNQMSG